MLEVDLGVTDAAERICEIAIRQPHSKDDYSCIANDSFPVA